jgi:hypothetical protein
MIATLAVALLAAASPADLAFMKGTWEGGAPEMKFEERWTEEAGGLMLGLSRTIKGDRAVAFEFLRVEFRKEGVFYVAQPGGGPKTEFKLTASDGKSATFENPSHDHPKLIRYSITGDGSLKADLDGNEGKQSFTFRRVAR